MGITRITGNQGNYRFNIVSKGSLHQVDSLMWFPKQFFQDERGRTWLGDNSKIYRWTGNGFRSYPLWPEAATNNFNRSFSFASDGKGNLFAFAEPGCVLIYQESIDRFNKVELPGKLSGIHAVFNPSPGLILIATRTGLFEMRSHGTTYSLDKVNTMEFSCFARSSKGVLFAGTWSEGLFRIGLLANSHLVAEKIEEFNQKNVTHIYIDKVDNLWISSDNGIILLKETLFCDPFRILTESYIQGLAIAPGGEMIFTDGSGLFCANESGLKNGRQLFGFKSTVLQALPVTGGFWCSDSDGKIWFSDLTGKEKQKYDFGHKGRAVFKMIQDRSGNIWACQDANNDLIRLTPGKEIQYYGLQQGLKSRIISLYLTKEGDFYCGGMVDSAFLFKYDPVNDRFLNLSQEMNFERNIDLNINDIVCTKDGVIWLATSFGLVKYEKGKMSRINLGSLTANSIKAITVDHDGYLWFANNKGLHRYKNGDLMSFDEKNGLPAKTIGYRCLLVDPEGKLWAGTVAGLSVSSQLKNPQVTETPRISSIIVNNIIYGEDSYKKLVINNKGFIRLRVASPEFPANNVRYEFMISSVDSVWKYFTKDEDIIIASLPPGDYSLKIRARQVGNFIYSEPLVWKFTIVRIWYERWWIQALIVLGILVLILVIIRAQSRKLRHDNLRLEKGILQRTQEILQKNNQIEHQNLDIIQKNEALSMKNIELEQAKNYAEEAAKAKAQFLSIMSHEIRTPMNAVIGITHLLMRNDPRQEQLEDLKILKFSAENLLGLINDVLDLNKIEAGKLAIENIEFNLRNLVTGVCSSLHYKASEKGINLDLVYDEKMPLYVFSDPLRLSQILNNLVSNAIKFTEEGQVDISITLLSRSDTNLNIRFSVKDTGVGIPKEMHEKIFDAFTQASSETSRKYGGTGLGLAITNRLVEMLGSEIRLISEQGRGSEFYFDIELAEGKSRRIEEKSLVESGNTPSFSGQKILLVEDNRINELIARKMLEEWNLKVDTAYNGAEAIKLTADNKYHLILMDLQMPGMDGYETTSAIRLQKPENIAIPIIALTASTRSEVHDKVVSSGMTDYVLKPFDPEVLFKKLITYI
jgi:signal transduction histidine kinase/CheY-like chemotaxis protein/ligand-binding sensor domain-containing protein